MYITFSVSTCLHNNISDDVVPLLICVAIAAVVVSVAVTSLVVCGVCWRRRLPAASGSETSSFLPLASEWSVCVCVCVCVCACVGYNILTKDILTESSISLFFP